MGDEKKPMVFNFWVFVIGYAALPLLNGFLFRHHVVGDAARHLVIGLAGGAVCAIASLPVCPSGEAHA
jgi:hypothetical protein